VSILGRERDCDGARRRSRGQALAETGIVVVLFIVMAVGALTFGHAMAVANMISHAARDGAQMAATWPNRGVCGGITSTTDLTKQVQRDMAALIGAQADNLAVNVIQTPTPAPSTPCSRPQTPLIGVNVTGCVPYLIPVPILARLNVLSGMLGMNCNGQLGFAVNTTQTLLDEGV
jgi:hypothetical protein